MHYLKWDTLYIYRVNTNGCVNILPREMTAIVTDCNCNPKRFIDDSCLSRLCVLNV